VKIELRIAYIASLVILGVFIAFAVFQPMVTDEDHNEALQAHLLEREDRWVIELCIFNHEAQDTDYTINVLISGELCTESFRLRPGGLGKCSYHISRDNLGQACIVCVDVYKDGEATPFEQVTYHLE